LNIKEHPAGSSELRNLLSRYFAHDPPHPIAKNGTLCTFFSDNRRHAVLLVGTGEPEKKKTGRL